MQLRSILLAFYLLISGISVKKALQLGSTLLVPQLECSSSTVGSTFLNITFIELWLQCCQCQNFTHLNWSQYVHWLMLITQASYSFVSSSLLAFRELLHLVVQLHHCRHRKIQSMLMCLRLWGLVFGLGHTIGAAPGEQLSETGTQRRSAPHPCPETSSLQFVVN